MSPPPLVQEVQRGKDIPAAARSLRLLWARWARWEAASEQSSEVKGGGKEARDLLRLLDPMNCRGQIEKAWNGNGEKAGRCLFCCCLPGGGMECSPKFFKTRHSRDSKIILNCSNSFTDNETSHRFVDYEQNTLAGAMQQEAPVAHPSPLILTHCRASRQRTCQ